MLSTPSRVEWALTTYTDCWQPVSASIYQLRRSRAASEGDGFSDRFLDALTERDELCWRMRQLTDRDRRLLYLWYLRELPANDIARALHISRRQCFRLRAAAIRKIVELGRADDAA